MKFVRNFSSNVWSNCWLLAAGCWLLAAGCWLLAAGCWLLAAGCWLLAALRVMRSCVSHIFYQRWIAAMTTCAQRSDVI